MNAPLYHIATNGNVTGPYAPDQIRSMWKAGSITADTQACAVGTETWFPVAGMVKPGLRAEGNLTLLGLAGIILFGLMALPAMLGGWLLISLPLMLLSALSYFRGRSTSAPALRPRALILSACAAAVLLCGGVAYYNDQRSQDEEAARYQLKQRFAEIEAKGERENKAFWFNYYKGDGIVAEDSPYAKEWNALQTKQQP